MQQTVNCETLPNALPILYEALLNADGFFTRLLASVEDGSRSSNVRSVQAGDTRIGGGIVANCGTIFYVDDNPKSRRLLTSVIKSCGFDVVSSGDPVEALSRIKKTSFDLALLDYQMPNFTGAQLAQKIKSTKPDIPVVLISGFSALPPFELIFVDAHVGRGATLDELLEIMHSLMHSRFAFAHKSFSRRDWRRALI